MGIDAAIDITGQERETILALLQQYLPGTEAWVYGSRVMGTSTPKSDFDLVVFATPEQRRRVGDLREAFEESNLPFRVDLFVWDDVPESFRDEIETDRVTLAGAAERYGTDGWIEKKLGNVITLKRGYDLPKRHRRHGSVPVVSSSGITDHHSESKARGPGVVTGRYGTLGQVFFIENNFWPLNTALYVQDFQGNDPQFVSYLLKSLDFSDYSDKAAVPGLNRNHLHEESVRIPGNTTEQRAIAHILGTLDDKIELNRRMNATLEAMARALFKSWLVDFDPVRAKTEGRDTGLPKEIADLFPDRLVDSELGEIPEGWEVATLGDHVVNFDSKRIPVSGAVRAERSGPYPYHGAAGVLDHVDDYIFDGVFLLLGEDGSVMRENGLAVTQYVYGKFWVNNHAHVLQGAGPVSTEQAYLHFSFEPVAPLVTGAVQPKLSQSRMKCVPFLFAGDDICRAFAEIVQPWFAQLRSRTEETRILAEMRDELLPILVSGRLQVSIEDAPRLDARHPRRATSEGAA